MTTNINEWLERALRGEKDLYDANLVGVNLTGANLTGANLAHANLERACLDAAKLDGANLTRANLYGADFTGSPSLAKANLTEAKLQLTTFAGADLTHAKLDGASLGASSHFGSDLTGATLMGATLDNTLLSATKLSGANLDGCEIGRALFVEMDLGPLCRARTLKFGGPSAIDYQSIVLSRNEPRLKDFLSSCGMPQVFVEYMVDCARSLDPRAIFSLMQSTFISYGTPDEAFAKRLNDALQQEGVVTFYFPHDAVPGRTLRETMHRAVNEHDRVILVCSRNSLDRKGLLNELEETLRRESRNGGASYLIPIRLDDAVLTWTPEGREDIAQSVRDRVISDFKNWETEEGVFTREVTKLIRALKKAPTF